MITAFLRLLGAGSVLRWCVTQWIPVCDSPGTLVTQIMSLVTNEFHIYLLSNRIQSLLFLTIIKPKQKSEICGACQESKPFSAGRLPGAALHIVTSCPADFPVFFSTVTHMERQETTATCRSCSLGCFLSSAITSSKSINHLVKTKKHKHDCNLCLPAWCFFWHAKRQTFS